MAISAIEARRAERERLIELARRYVDSLARRLEVLGAVVTGSVARGDFNLWSDVDILVVARELPGRAPDRAGLLLACAPPRTQPVGYTPQELERAWYKHNRLVREALERGIVLRGADFLERAIKAR